MRRRTSSSTGGSRTLKIEHWDVWRQRERPKAYFLWAARLQPGKDRIETLVREVRSLSDTYLDGAGLFAWQPRDDARGYEPAGISERARVTTLDDVLYRIASEISSLVDAQGEPPPPVRPEHPAVGSHDLAVDETAE